MKLTKVGEQHPYISDGLDAKNVGSRKKYVTFWRYKRSGKFVEMNTVENSCKYSSLISPITAGGRVRWSWYFLFPNNLRAISVLGVCVDKTGSMAHISGTGIFDRYKIKLLDCSLFDLDR